MLASLLPAPKHNYEKQQPVIEEKKVDVSQQNQKKKRVIPPYPHRLGFIPLGIEDFEDGGAYPELHVAQYPLNMGRPGSKSTALIPVQMNENGSIRTDMIVKQGANANRLVQSQLSDLKPKKPTLQEISLPTEEEEQATADRTKAALESLLEGKIKGAKPTNNGAIVNPNTNEPQYIRYTPNPNAPGYKEEISQRVIKMVDAQVDPLEPPKHKNMKVPYRPPSPPVPVLHSPPRKLTVSDQQAWKVPPCISNWKNAHGFIVPLDKRLAADGRGLQEVTINNKFATLTESLYIAERKAVQDLSMRNELRAKVALREKEERETKLRDMANRARLERSGRFNEAEAQEEEEEERPVGRRDDEEEEAPRRRRTYSSESGKSESESEESEEEERNSDVEGFERETEEDKINRQQRERIRLDRRKEREREMRLNNMKGNLRKSKMERDENRDVSEKIALGMLKGTGKLTGESIYDSRLFNQSSGMDAGFGAEDEYTAYSRPLFHRGEGESIYRPKKADSDVYGDAEEQLAKLSNTSRFRPDKGFKGAEGGSSAGPRDAPVQFEKVKEYDPYDRKKEDDHRGYSDDRERNRDRDRDDRRRGRSSSPPRNNKKSRHHSDEDD